MKNLRSYLLIFLTLSGMLTKAEEKQEKQLFNVLSLPNGAYIVKAPNSYTTVSETSNRIVEWTKEAIIDGTTYKGWNSREDEKFPLEFVFELSEECSIEKLGFNNECEREYKGICAKGIKVEVSTTGAESGYTTVLEPKLEEYAATKYFDIKPVNARWIRISILSNYGNKKNTELMEIEALGSYVNEDVKSINLTGDWTSTWGTVSIRQNGSSINGCYKYRNGKITNAGMDRRILSFKWVEDGQGNAGQASLVVNEDGTRLNGIWSFGENLKKYGIWTFTRKGDTPTQCYQVDETKKVDEEKQSRLKTEIESTGKLTIYGINFETGSANIKPESYPTLDEIFNMLKDNAAMKLSINGHTDNQGSRERNQKLSTNRAESVKTYLVSKGITADRLEAFGKGEDFPIADNETQLGRAANRRVELILNQAK
ncbi:MAG: OmpA family protein [Paludibacteraceae bacterium]|nr:OmpA family protein [Paludibacteraceae bacterium]